MDEKMLDEFDSNIESIEKVHNFLLRLSNDKSVPTIFEQPIISMLVTGCDYLSVNLSTLKQKYELKQ